VTLLTPIGGHLSVHGRLVGPLSEQGLPKLKTDAEAA
jgi:hypothetical protein